MTFRVTASPTPEIYECPLEWEQRKVGLRIWDGVTDDGIPIDVYVFSIVAKNKEDTPRLAATLPDYMKPSREVHKIDIKGDGS